MVEQAKIQSVITKFREYNAVINSFKLKYNAVPGDMKNAGDYWSGAVVGNGDGNWGGVGNQLEPYKVWNHLQLAELIPGEYDGIIDIPTFTINSRELGYLPFSHLLMYKMRPNTNLITIIQPPSAAGSESWDLGLNSVQASSIDNKIDDNVPSTGKIVTFTSVLGQCVYTTGTSPHSYVNYVNTGLTSYELSLSPAPFCTVQYVLDIQR